MPNLIDTHAHLTFNQLADHIQAVIERAKQAGVNSIITVGTDPQHNALAVELAEKHDNIYAALGIHPHDAKTVTPENLSEITQLAKNQKVIAIGETGLDFYYNLSEEKPQKKVFAQHLDIAAKLNLPVIVHSRNAFDPTLAILNEHPDIKKVVFHCFTGTPDQAKILLDHGFLISFTGVITFKNADALRQTAKFVPIESIMLETDCPYMSPAPKRSQKINEPALMIHTAKLMAEIKGISLEEIAEKTTQNAVGFFNLPLKSLT